MTFNAEVPQSGWLKEWTLMLHGTRESPYVQLPAGDPRSKLAIVKKAHEDRAFAYWTSSTHLHISSMKEGERERDWKRIVPKTQRWKKKQTIICPAKYFLKIDRERER